MSDQIRINGLSLITTPADDDSFPIDGTNGTRRITVQKLKENIIDDSQQSSTETYSSSKVEQMVSKSQTTLQSEIDNLETELQAEIGDLTNLDTAEKGSLVGAVNELNGDTTTLSSSVDAIQDSIAPLICDNAGAHNAIYRGKNLGTSVTDAQYAAIKAGTFEDLYIGDYWTIDSRTYRIAAFDYYYNCGDTACTTHHVVIVPDAILYNAKMNETNITDGGYVGSVMYTTNLESAKTTIKTAFGESHILKHRVYLVNAVSSGRASGGGWFDSEVDLMNEQMVYGSSIFMPMSSGTSTPANYRVEKSQLPLFQHNHALINNRQIYWLRDVVTAAHFAGVDSLGNAYYGNASNSLGVRPAFCIS